MNELNELDAKRAKLAELQAAADQTLDDYRAMPDPEHMFKIGPAVLALNDARLDLLQAELIANSALPVWSDQFGEYVAYDQITGRFFYGATSAECIDRRDDARRVYRQHQERNS